MYDLAMNMDRAGIDQERLEKALANSGLSAAELARSAGIDKGTLSLILSGKRHSTTATVMLKLARTLNVSVDYLLGLSDEAEPTALMLGDLLMELTRVARRLSGRQQRDLLLMARSYLADNQQKAIDPDRLVDDLLGLFEEYEGTVSRDRLIALLDDALAADDTPPSDSTK